MKTKARNDELVSQFQADAIIFKTDMPNDFCILSFLTRAKLLQRGWQKFHVGNHKEEQVRPEDKANKAVAGIVADEIEEDDVGDDDGYQEKKRRNLPRGDGMLPR